MNNAVLAQALENVPIVFNKGWTWQYFISTFLNVLSAIKLRVMAVEMYSYTFEDLFALVSFWMATLFLK